jgi:type I restriction enzyme S subunit
MNNTQWSVLGAVPTDWKVAELQDLGSWGGGKTPRRSNEEYWNGETPWVSPKDMGGSVVQRTEDHVTQVALSEENLTVYEPGSVMVVFRSGVLRHTFPVATCNHPFTVNQDMKVLTPGSEVDSRFAFHLIDHLGPVVLQKATKVGTTVESVDTDSFMSLSVGVPRPDEQGRIADVLDTVDAAIQETDRVVEKQEQVKTGLLQDLLTRGLDANGRLRDPERKPEAFRETELGRHPKTWDTVRLGEVLHEIQAGKSPSCPDIPSSSGEWGVVKVSAIRPEGFQAEENKAIEDENHIHPEYEIEDGDLLISRANTSDLVGITCLVEDPPDKLMLCDKSLRLVVDQDKVNARYLFQATQVFSFRRQVEAAGTGSSGTMKNISQTDIRSFQVPLPPLREQVLIADRVESLTRKIDGEKAYRRKLQRLKTALMQDLLTGRVRVPEAEARVDEVVA